MSRCAKPAEAQPRAFQLDFPIPEIGAEPGDWIQVHPTKGVIVSRQLSPDAVVALRSRLRRVLAILERGPGTPPQPRLRVET